MCGSFSSSLLCSCSISGPLCGHRVGKAITYPTVRISGARSQAAHLQEIDREVLKEMMGGMLEKVELYPTSLQARLHYRFATGDLVASPRGFEPRLPP